MLAFFSPAHTNNIPIELLLAWRHQHLGIDSRRVPRQMRCVGHPHKKTFVKTRDMVVVRLIHHTRLESFANFNRFIISASAPMLFSSRRLKRARTMGVESVGISSKWQRRSHCSHCSKLLTSQRHLCFYFLIVMLAGRVEQLLVLDTAA